MEKPRKTYTVDNSQERSKTPSEMRKTYEIKSESTPNDSNANPSDLWAFQIGWNRFVQPNEAGPPQDRRFLSNAIRTSKYTNMTFFPLNLLHQLSKGANIYYIIIIIMQCIRPISITGGSPTNLPPLSILIAVSMVKDFIEDRRR